MVINMEPLKHFIRTVGSMLDFAVEMKSDASAVASNSDRASSARNLKKNILF